MSNIGEDLEYIEKEDLEYIERYGIELNSEQSVKKLLSVIDKFEVRGEELAIVKRAIGNVLTERWQDKAKIKKLEAEIQNYNKQMYLDCIDNKYIPKQEE